MTNTEEEPIGTTTRIEIETEDEKETMGTTTRT